MKIIRFKINAEVQTLLRATARKYKIEDKGYVEDLYALFRLKGAGLPSKERIVKMAKSAAKRKAGSSETALNMLISKRKMALAQLVGLPYFHGLATLPNPVSSVDRLLARLKELYSKTRQAQCISCSLLKQCDFGQQYERNVTDITKVVDPDFDQKVHKDCPVRPEIGAINQSYAAAKTLVALAKAAAEPEANVVDDRGGADLEDISVQLEELSNMPPPPEDDGTAPDQSTDYHLPVDHKTPPERTNRFDGKLSGEALVKVSEKLIKDVSQLQISLFDLGKKFSQALTAAKAGKFSPVSHVEANKDESQIKKVSDLPEIIPSQHGLPAEVFDSRLEKKQLTKAQYQKREEKQKLLYLLIDISASMTAPLGAGCMHGMLTRGALSSLFTLACARRVRADKGVLFSRFFTGNVTDLVTAKTDDEYEHMLRVLSLPDYTSGSTDIGQVIKVAAMDIAQAKEPLASSEILLVTDCEDYIDTSMIRTHLGKTELNILDVSGGSSRTAASMALKSVANSYYKANEKEPDISKMVTLL